MDLFAQLEQKQCSRCGETKDLFDFPKLTRSRDGHEGVCCACRRKTRNAWSDNNREHVRAKARNFVARHKERLNAKSRQRYREDPAKFKAIQRNRRLADPSLRFRAHLKEKFSLTLDQYNQMVAAHGGLCAICLQSPTGRRAKLCIDHDHSTGEIRGLLCDTCNRALGLLKDDAEVLQNAIGYLAAHRFKLKAA